MHGINAQFPFFYFLFFQFWISMFLIEKKIPKPIASLVMSGANLGLDGNCWENMPIIGRELNGGQL